MLAGDKVFGVILVRVMVEDVVMNEVTPGE